MRAVVAAAVLVASSSAFAQFSINLSMNASHTSQTLNLNNSNCNDSQVIFWSLSSVPPANEQCTSPGFLNIWLTQSGCGNGPAADDLDAGQIAESTFNSGNTSGFVSFLPSTLPIFADAGPCSSAQVNVTYNVCASYPFAIPQFGQIQGNCSSPSFAVGNTTPTVVFDTVPPAAPVIDSVGSGDTTLGVSVHTDDTNTASFQLYYLPSDSVNTDAGFSGYFNVGPSILLVSGDTQGSAIIDNLQNGVDYTVVAYGLNAGGTSSGPSNLMSGTPQHVPGFFEAYKEAGGTDKGGCAAAGGAVMLPALLAALGLMRRRRQ